MPLSELLLTGRRYRLELTPEQTAYAECVGGICRFVWNVALEQRQTYRRRGAFIGYRQQRAQLVEAKQSEPWLAEAPSHCLLEVLRTLEKTCRAHGAFRVHWQSKNRTEPSFRLCGHRQHADLNAATNILARGLGLAHSPGHGDHARTRAGTTLVAA